MSNPVQAARTFLFVPGTRPERFAKALAMAADPDRPAGRAAGAAHPRLARE
ncbi:hypothetical protein [Ramlibacter rhizophilus]|uniref:hypothetical protein n=1 Tax=Ramlibacter rhizophilus TaxID=1781167 RepID=UPI0030B9047E